MYFIEACDVIKVNNKLSQKFYFYILQNFKVDIDFGFLNLKQYNAA